MRVQTALQRLPDDLVHVLANRIYRDLPVALRPPLKGPLRPAESRVLLAAAIGIGVLPSHPSDWDPRVVIALWPRTVAHVVAGSLGYATPTLAARIVADARARRPNWCEWIVTVRRPPSGAASHRREHVVRPRRVGRWRDDGDGASPSSVSCS
jgi:hypothetical protein